MDPSGSATRAEPAESATADATLKDAVERLAPWHFNVRLSETFTTRDGNRPKPGEGTISLIDPEELRPLLTSLYPEGLSGRAFLDAGCNGGGYCVVAKRLGADYAYGFDAREHWINQANFLKSTLGLTGVDFECAAMHEANLSREYDISLFKGIFYHLPDPVHALERVCRVTRDVIIVDTATEGARGEFTMHLNPEGQKRLMTGVHGLAWWPSGPDLLAAILARFGFGETREIFWNAVRNSGGRTRAGRCRIVAARSPERLARVEAKIMNPYPPASDNPAPASPTPARGEAPRKRGLAGLAKRLRGG